MHILNITVRGKVAAANEREFYVCGNSDYVIHFDFDEEWNEHGMKTARFIKEDGTYTEQVFTRDECPVPVIENTYRIMVGVYAGNLSTTTAAYVSAKKSILCGGGVHVEPEPDVYNQIIENLDVEAKKAIDASVAAEEHAADAQAAADDARSSATSAEEYMNQAISSANDANDTATAVREQVATAERFANAANAAMTYSQKSAEAAGEEAEEAAKSAEVAKAEKEDAQSAAEDAEQHAESAQESATLANEKAAQAVYYAGQANAYKEQAMSYASIATTKANAATASAKSAAASEKAAEESAKEADTDAQTASNAANAATDAAAAASTSATKAATSEQAAHDSEEAANAARTAAEAAADRADAVKTSIPADYTALAEAVSLKAPGIICEESGNIVSVNDATEGQPLSVVSHIDSVDGVTEVSLTRTGKNIFGGMALAQSIVSQVNGATLDEEAETIQYTATSVSTKELFKGAFKADTVYTFIMTKAGGSAKTPNMGFKYTDETKVYSLGSFDTENKRAVQKSGSARTVLGLYGYNSSGTTILQYDQCGVFEGVVTADDFVPYEGETLTVTLPETVTSGEFDWTTGVLTINEDGASRTVQLDHQPLDLLKGSNNLWSSTGDTDLRYLADTKLYIDNQIAAIAAAVINA